jgi:hypothetical protein
MPRPCRLSLRDFEQGEVAWNVRPEAVDKRLSLRRVPVHVLLSLVSVLFRDLVRL